MVISLIVAMDENQGIGKDNGLPWHISSDLRRFRRLTMGHHLILGRKTYQVIGKPLAGRHTIVLSRSNQVRGCDCPPPGIDSQAVKDHSTTCCIAHSFEQALALASSREKSETFVGGGRDVFIQALPYAQRIYLTRVHAISESDTFFPEIDWGEWQPSSPSIFHPASEQDDFPTTFSTLERVTPARQISMG